MFYLLVYGSRISFVNIRLFTQNNYCMTEEQVARLFGELGDIRRIVTDHDRRFTNLEQRMIVIEQRIGVMEQRLTLIDTRLGLIEQRLGNIEQWVPVDHRHLQPA